MVINVSNNFLKLLYVLLGILFIVSIGLNVWYMSRGVEHSVIEREVVRIERDTIHDTIPDVRYEKLLYVRRDTLRLVDTIPGDTVHMLVEVPISQKEYSDDSTYRAWVSGYGVNLDSIDIYRKEVYIERELTKYKRDKKLIIGPQVGVGYDVKNGNFAPTVGIGVTYKLFGF